MNRRNALFSLVGLLALLGLSTAAISPTVANTGAAAHFNCCDDPCCPPGCCPECPPDCLPDALQAKAASFTCPLTGEQLPCSDCCPLSQQTAKVAKDCPPCPFCP